MGIKKDGVLFIGLDSANLNEILRWREQLPNFKHLMEKGCYTHLHSTIPPFSPPAWTGMMTGKNPAKHNIFDWISFPKEPGENIQINTSKDVKEATLWEILSEKGLKSCIINVPVLNYPANPLNGIMVAGIPGHTSHKGVTYPPRIYQELEKVTHGYEIIPSINLEIPGKEERYMKEFARVLSKRLKTAVYLLNKEKWDFFMVVFFLLDSVQHYYWHHLEQDPFSNDPTQGAKYGGMIKEFYKKVDSATGRLLKEVENSANVIIASDHGMQSSYGNFYINNLLRREGLLSLQKAPREKSNIRKISQRLATRFSLLSPRITKRLIKTLPRGFIEKFTFRGGIKSSTEVILENMDLDNSIAYGLGEYGQIFLHKNDEKEKTIEVLNKTIREKYEMNLEVYRKTELYTGKYLVNAPDITYIIEENRIPIRSNITPNKKLLIPPKLPGEHARKGVFIAYGPGIENTQKINSVGIYDILPTILSLLGITLPSDLDGKAIEAIANEYKQKHNRLRETIRGRVSKIRKKLND